MVRMKERAFPPPRIGSPRHLERPTLGAVYPEIASAMGFRPYGWQRFITDASLELRQRTGKLRPLRASRLRLAATNVGVLVGRQSGKSLWTASRVALQCMLPDLPEVAGLVGIKAIKAQHVGITAQDRIGALARWYEHVDMIMDGDLGGYVRRVRRKNGEERIEWRNGSTYTVVTPSRTGARGMHLDCVVIDEALAHPGWLLGVMRPTQAQRDGAVGCIGAQLVIVSNAGDETSELLNDQRELGRRAVVGDDPRRCWFEWSIPDDADPYDEEIWKQTLPTLDVVDGISLEFLRTEAEDMPVEDWAREYLCRYTPRRHAYVLDPAAWEQLPESGVSDGPVIVAVDATPERTSATVVASNEGWDGRTAVEILDQRQGTEWVLPFLVDLSTRNDILVVVDGFGPMSSIISPLERSGIAVEQFRVGEVVNGAALLAELVATGGLSHQRDPRFAPATVGRRKVGDRWAFQRSGDADISPFVAASLAVWGVSEQLLAPPSIH
jgi:hypothetical protein